MGRPNLIGKFPISYFQAYPHVNFHGIFQVMFSRYIFMSFKLTKFTHNVTPTHKNSHQLKMDQKEETWQRHEKRGIKPQVEHGGI